MANVWSPCTSPTVDAPSASSTANYDVEIVCLSDDGGVTVSVGLAVVDTSVIPPAAPTYWIGGTDVTGSGFLPVPCAQPSLDVEIMDTCYEVRNPGAWGATGDKLIRSLFYDVTAGSPVLVATIWSNETSGVVGVTAPSFNDVDPCRTVSPEVTSDILCDRVGESCTTAQVNSITTNPNDIQYQTVGSVGSVWTILIKALTPTGQALINMLSLECAKPGVWIEETVPGPTTFAFPASAVSIDVIGPGLAEFRVDIARTTLDVPVNGCSIPVLDGGATVVSSWMTTVGVWQDVAVAIDWVFNQATYDPGIVTTFQRLTTIEADGTRTVTDLALDGSPYIVAGAVEVCCCDEPTSETDGFAQLIPVEECSSTVFTGLTLGASSAPTTFIALGADVADDSASWTGVLPIVVGNGTGAPKPPPFDTADYGGYGVDFDPTSNIVRVTVTAELLPCASANWSAGQAYWTATDMFGAVVTPVSESFASPWFSLAPGLPGVYGVDSGPGPWTMTAEYPAGTFAAGGRLEFVAPEAGGTNFGANFTVLIEEESLVPHMVVPVSLACTETLDVNVGNDLALVQRPRVPVYRVIDQTWGSPWNLTPGSGSSITSVTFEVVDGTGVTLNTPGHSAPLATGQTLTYGESGDTLVLSNVELQFSDPAGKVAVLTLETP